MLSNKVQLITYPDSLGGNLEQLELVMDKHLKDYIHGIHILPFFPSSADRGFAPIDYQQVEPSFGDWDNIKSLGKKYELMADFMVNHVSAQSKAFKDYLAKGEESEYSEMFIPIEKFWADGVLPDEDLKKIFLRKPDTPFTEFEIGEQKKKKQIWTSFGEEQIDIDINSPKTRKYIEDTLKFLAAQNISQIRLDAFAYTTKKAGTACFFNTPELFDILNWVQNIAKENHLSLLPEVHIDYERQLSISENGFWVYDFNLPFLVIHALEKADKTHLENWLKICPKQQYTTLDTHDGIPVQPDIVGLIPIDEAKEISELLIKRGANINRVLKKKGEELDFDVHQINCTYYSALGENDKKYLAARVIQLFSPGIPQIYYTGILAGINDQERYITTGVGREVNRHNYSLEEIEQEIKKPVAIEFLNLIKFRNDSPAFNGNFQIIETDKKELIHLKWQNMNDYAELKLNLSTSNYEILSNHELNTPSLNN